MFFHSKLFLGILYFPESLHSGTDDDKKLLSKQTYLYVHPEVYAKIEKATRTSEGRLCTSPFLREAEKEEEK